MPNGRRRYYILRKKGTKGFLTPEEKLLYGDEPIFIKGKWCTYSPLGSDWHYHTGCVVPLSDWVRSSGDALFVIGLCVVAFVKFTFLSILRYEIKEMIQKIRLMQNESQQMNGELATALGLYNHSEATSSSTSSIASASPRASKLRTTTDAKATPVVTTNDVKRKANHTTQQQNTASQTLPATQQQPQRNQSNPPLLPLQQQQQQQQQQPVSKVNAHSRSNSNKAKTTPDRRTSAPEDDSATKPLLDKQPHKPHHHQQQQQQQQQQHGGQHELSDFAENRSGADTSWCTFRPIHPERGEVSVSVCMNNFHAMQPQPPTSTTTTAATTAASANFHPQGFRQGGSSRQTAI